ncbi:hypothetical protein HanPSC8_Chr13g0593721 [Helianthus annuus]|nr:hypothetical protein HanPSC8_Chr13g0593721 [Helianthus annuus]
MFARERVFSANSSCCYLYLINPFKIEITNKFEICVRPRPTKLTLSHFHTCSIFNDSSPIFSP